MAKNPIWKSRLPRYSAIVAAATAASPAYGGGVVTVNTPFSVNSTHTSVFWDIDGGGANDFLFHWTSSSDRFILAQRLEGPNRWAHGTASAEQLIKAMATGATVGPVMAAGFKTDNVVYAFFTYSHHIVGGLHAGTQNVGFQFFLDGGNHFGWANISISAGSLTVNNWAYNDVANYGIYAGTAIAVPEPANSAAGLGLLALGAAGVSAYKRRKQTAAA